MLRANFNAYSILNNSAQIVLLNTEILPLNTQIRTKAVIKFIT